MKLFSRLRIHKILLLCLVLLTFFSLSFVIFRYKVQAVQTSVNPNKLVIIRISSQFPQFSRSISDQQQVSQIYALISQAHSYPTQVPSITTKSTIDQQIEALKQHPTCHFSSGVQYQLIFYKDDTVMNSSILTPHGECSTVTNQNGNTKEVLNIGPIYKEILSIILHAFNLKENNITCVQKDSSTNNLGCL